MAGSRRKLKRTSPKVQVGIKKRKKNQKASVPLEVAENRPDLCKRLNKTATWHQEQTLIKNYAQNEFVLNPNEGFGRNQTAPALVTKEERQQRGEETYSDDDELRVVCNQERKTGQAPPKRLTSRQRQILEALMSKHGEDVEVSCCCCCCCCCCYCYYCCCHEVT
eukprot:jgi/Chrzof1/12234/Cz06g26150.t1